MKKLAFCVVFFCVSGNLWAQSKDSLILRKIYDQSLEYGLAYKNLSHLCKGIGNRVSGSPNYFKAVDWAKKLMESYAFANIEKQEVPTSYWLRGSKESLVLMDGGEKINLELCALGGSVPTIESGGIRGELIEIKHIDDFAKIGESYINNKIVFYNVPFNQKAINPRESYDNLVDFRRNGAIYAAKYGAKGVILRSITTENDRFPHSGDVLYQEGVPNIPAVAVSVESANILSNRLATIKLPPVQVRMQVNSTIANDKSSVNLAAEITGKKNTQQYILVVAHLDTWDLGEGAHDNGAGCVQAIEALRILKDLDAIPEHTIKVLLYTDEMTKGHGIAEYVKATRANGQICMGVVNCDAGGFRPSGFEINAKLEQLEMIKKWSALFFPYGVSNFAQAKRTNEDFLTFRSEPSQTYPNTMPIINYQADNQRYYDLHHSVKDVFETVNRRELEMGAASIASFLYLYDKYCDNILSVTP